MYRAPRTLEHFSHPVFLARKDQRPARSSNSLCSSTGDHIVVFLKLVCCFNQNYMYKDYYTIETQRTLLLVLQFECFIYDTLSSRIDDPLI